MAGRGSLVLRNNRVSAVWAGQGAAAMGEALLVPQCHTRSPGYLLLALGVVANGQLAAREELGRQHWGDAAEADGLPGGVECLQDILHRFGDDAVLALGGPSAQVFGHSKAT